jgi:hypothetical protein
MTQPNDARPQEHAEPGDAPAAAARPPYEPPSLEALGPWSVVTVQQSVPIVP